MKKSNKIINIDFSPYISPDVEYNDDICQTIWKLLHTKDKNTSDVIRRLSAFDPITICVHIMITLLALKKMSVSEHYEKIALDTINTVKNGLPESSFEWIVINNMIETYNHLFLIRKIHTNALKLSDDTAEYNHENTDDTDDTNDTDDTDESVFSDIINPLMKTISDEEKSLMSIELMNKINEELVKMLSIEKSTSHQLFKAISDEYHNMGFINQIENLIRDAICTAKYIVVDTSKTVRFTLINTNSRDVYKIPKIALTTDKKVRRKH